MQQERERFRALEKGKEPRDEVKTERKKERVPERKPEREVGSEKKDGVMKNKIGERKQNNFFAGKE